MWYNIFTAQNKLSLVKSNQIVLNHTILILKSIWWTYQEFLCSINNHVMKDPVSTADSNVVYERATIGTCFILIYLIPFLCYLYFPIPHLPTFSLSFSLSLFVSLSFSFFLFVSLSFSLSLFLSLCLSLSLCLWCKCIIQLLHRM